MTPSELKKARQGAGLTTRQAAELVGVTTVTWQRYEGQTSRQTVMPHAASELFLLKIGTHPEFILSQKIAGLAPINTSDT